MLKAFNPCSYTIVYISLTFYEIHILTTLLRKYTSWHWNILHTQWQVKNFRKGGPANLIYCYHFMLTLFSDTTIIQRKKKIHVCPSPTQKLSSFLKGTSFTRVHGIPFYVTERCENLPDEALKYYKVATKKQLKSRLSVKFGKLQQTPFSSIANESIR